MYEDLHVIFYSRPIFGHFFRRKYHQFTQNDNKDEFLAFVDFFFFD